MEEVPLHLLRHGEPSLAGRMLGRTNCPATAAGHAGCVSQVAALEPAAVVTSDLARARTTAEGIAAARGLPLRIDARWRELDFGEWDGLTAADVDPAALGRFWRDPDAAPPPGGERWSALLARVTAAVAALDLVPTLVVTHAGPIRAVLVALCGLEQRQSWAFDLPYGALLSLRRWAGPPPAAQIVSLKP